MDEDLKYYSFHANWELEKNLVKPFETLMTAVNDTIEFETHEMLKEEALLFKCYLYKSGAGEKSKRSADNAMLVLEEVKELLTEWKTSPKKDGFLAVAYALEAWINMHQNSDKFQSCIKELQVIYNKYKNEDRNEFKATIHFIKGFSLSRLGSNRGIDSINEFKKANEIFPGNPEYLFSLALMKRRFSGPNQEIKGILNQVLEIRPDYLFAKVELAKVLYTIEGSAKEATKLLQEIKETITVTKPITTENMKILGFIMQIYIKMDNEDTEREVKDIYNLAKQSKNISSFVTHQRSNLARNKCDWGEYGRLLEKALSLDTFNVTVKIQLARHKILSCKGEILQVEEEFNLLVKEHEGDNLAMVNILAHYGDMLCKKNGNVIPKMEEAIKIALQYYQLNGGENARIQFNKSICFAVSISNLRLEKYYKTNTDKSDVICKFVKFLYDMRFLHRARTYSERALKMELEEDQRNQMMNIYVDTHIVLSTDPESLNSIDIIDIEKELLGKFEFKKSILQENISFGKALDGYFKAALIGHKGAINRLLSALEVLDDRNEKFYQTCAHIDVGISSLKVENGELLIKLEVILNSIEGSRGLKRLRNQQFEMEKAWLLYKIREENKEKLANDALAKMEDVIQTCRSLLNSVMHKLTKQNKDRKVKLGNTLDFFWVRRNFDRTKTAEKVKSKLKEYKWIEFDDDLISFLVKIQPCTDPRKNNWIIAFMEFNNTSKHQRFNKFHEKFKVYPEDDDATQDYVEKEYKSIDLARTTCNNVAYILDNLYEFLTWWTDSE